MSSRARRTARGALPLLLLCAVGCGDKDVQSSPERLARAYVHLQSHAQGDHAQLKQVFELLSPDAKAALNVHGDRAMRTLGIRLDAAELLVPQGAHFPKEIAEIQTTSDGDDAALVSVRGEDKEVRLRCVRLRGRWWVAPTPSEHPLAPPAPAPPAP